ncbi:unnamed protein product [Linum trigynum]|uniref:Uncharacterized protein n=1 Tax=Linum trigynum TaxID=586398 RepID=A0AAV2FPU2_9ROSI
MSRAPQGRPPLPSPRGPVDGELEDLTEKEAAQNRLNDLVDLVVSERQEQLEESRWLWRRLDDLHAMMVAMQGGWRPPSQGVDGGSAARMEAAALGTGGEIGASAAPAATCASDGAGAAGGSAGSRGVGRRQRQRR